MTTLLSGPETEAETERLSDLERGVNQEILKEKPEQNPERSSESGVNPGNEIMSTLKQVARRLCWLQEQYFRPKDFEKSGELYERLGIKLFKKYTPFSGDYFRKIMR